MSSPDNTGFDLLPVVNNPPNAAEELSLLDQLADPSALPPTTPEPSPLGRSYAYDFVERRLLAAPAGGPLMTYGIDSLKAWIDKTMKTDRGAAPVHRVNDFGLEGAYDIIDGGPFDASAMAELEERIRDAMRVHPRIEDITNFGAEYDSGTEGGPPDDAAYVSFTVVVSGDDIDALDVTRYPMIAPGPAETE